MNTITMGNTSEVVKYSVYTYHWYVSGIEDIYSSTVTFSWYENGHPPESVIFEEIIRQHDLDESDLNVIRIMPTCQVELKFLKSEG